MHTSTLENLRCEYLSNPLGIDTDRPRFSWEIADQRKEARQTAYRILVASNPEVLERGDGDVLDTGRVDSNETLHIEYNGKPLASGGEYFWKSQVWTVAADGKESVSGWSMPARFSIGLLKASDWKAKWITAPECIPDSPTHIGYMSVPGVDVESNKWIQIDLGERKSFDRIRLNPAAGRGANRPFGGESAPGRNFPARFKIEVSDHESMSPCSIVVDETKEVVATNAEVGKPVKKPTKIRFKVENPRRMPMEIRFSECKGRYVRLTAIMNPKAVMQLAGMEILHEETDLARGCKATALDSHEALADGFGISLLTAGKTGYDGGSRRLLRPAPLLRGEFVCKKPVRSAIAYATALGNYQLHINGTRIDSFLAPGYSEYEKRVLVQAYDVTSLLQSGTNVAGAVLADGWYRSRYRMDTYDQFKDFAQGRFGDAIPRFLLQVQVDYEDGTREIIGTDESWRCTLEGPYRKTSMYDGVVYDAQREIPSWDKPAFQDKGWEPAVVSEPPEKPYLCPQMVHPITCREEFKPVTIKPTPAGTWICDFGQGVGGVCRVTLDGPAGTKVKLCHAMALNEDGSLFTENLLGNHDNGDVYILAGKGPQTFTPDFTFHGFRYVEISGIKSAKEIVDITSLMIADNCPVAGMIETSDARLNKLWKSVSMTYLSCLKSALADVADRDERWAWMGDCGSTLTQSMAYHFDISTYFRKRCLDMIDGQWADGYFPSQSPRMDDQRTCTWSDAVAIMAWTSWLNYGDQRLLRETYAPLRKYFFLIAGLYEKRSYPLWPEHNGDWLSAFMTIRPDAKGWSDLDMGDNHYMMSKDLFSAIDLLYLSKLFRNIAETLGEKNDSEAAASLMGQLSTDPMIAQLREHPPFPGTQSAYALMLGWEIAQPDEKPGFVKLLLDAIESKGRNVTTGTITTHLLLKSLSDSGHHDLAYHLAMKPEFPSYGFMIDNSTVLWERFDSYIPGMGFSPHSGMNGLNHIGFGAISEWIFGDVGGIRPDTSAPSYKHFLIAPRMGGGVEWSKSDYNSVRGKIVSDWKVEGPGISMRVVIPPNTKATVFVPAAEGSAVTEGSHPAENAEGVKFVRKEPGAAVYEVQSGTYEFHSSRLPIAPETLVNAC